ncbi:hypothetical protein ACMD2_26945 [Ananas comosus]|uniref:Uncharacterized protein n=1 Tax=Ananas comosus TaxID=4615 RepID=A0A199V7U0_ANACO|nr:hypothetical protein ACMD2_26945 [Ananas comosus]
MDFSSSTASTIDLPASWPDRESFATVPYYPTRVPFNAILANSDSGILIKHRILAILKRFKYSSTVSPGFCRYKAKSAIDNCGFDL